MNTTLPEGVTVLVVSKGGDELLQLGGRRGWHFPRTDEGAYGGAPRDSAEAIVHLEKLRGQGARYLILPKPQFWWQEYYKEFCRHLETQHRLAARDENACIIYELHKAEAGGTPNETTRPNSGPRRR